MTLTKRLACFVWGPFAGQRQLHGTWAKTSGTLKPDDVVFSMASCDRSTWIIHAQVIQVVQQSGWSETHVDEELQEVSPICRLLNGWKSAQQLHHVTRRRLKPERLVILVQVMRCPRNTEQGFATLKDNDGIQKTLCIKNPSCFC